MTETDRAVDDAERAREQGGGGRWFRLSPGRLLAGRLRNRRRLLPDELGVLVVLALLVAGIGKTPRRQTLTRPRTAPPSPPSPRAAQGA